MIEKIVVAAVVCWINFVMVDVLIGGLPEVPGVRGAKHIAHAIRNYGGNLNGGYMMGNIVCSPDASAGTLLASSCYYAFGSWEGGLLAATVVYFGNRICADPGYAGTTGTLTTTALIFIFSHFGFSPANFVAGMVLAIVTIQGLHHKYSSKILGSLARKMGTIEG
ncbi:MAG: hypothetical protein QMC78_03340 [Methanocellales archaeon]|nr:hypothetical protein [Methanocellales archaeon]